MLERPFGPAINSDQDGWYGSGDQHDGHTMVLRSTNERGTSVAAFTFELPFPYGRVVIKSKEAVHVPNGYGAEGDPVPPKPKVKPEYDFGHEPNAPPVMVPPGVPPDERVNLNGDEVDDLVITGRRAQGDGTPEQGHFIRGISPLPGTELLMTRERWGVLGPFRLREEEVLTPERLASGLAGNLFVWVLADGERVFIPLVQHPIGLPDAAQRWSFTPHVFDGAFIYRTMEYGRPIIGALEIVSDGRGGQFGVRAQTWVDEGQVLEVR